MQEVVKGGGPRQPESEKHGVGEGGRKSSSALGSAGRSSSEGSGILPPLNFGIFQEGNAQRQSDSQSHSSVVTAPMQRPDFDESSESPDHSEERGDVKADLITTAACIVKQNDEELWGKVRRMSVKQLKAVATYKNCQNLHTPLHMAAKVGLFPMVALLMEHGADYCVDKFDEHPDDQKKKPEDRRPFYTPLTYAVEFCWVHETCNEDIIALLLKKSRHKADALCMAIQCYEEEEDPQKRAKYRHILYWLLKRPEIVGSMNSVGYLEGSDLIEGCIDIPDQRRGLTALQLICLYRDREICGEILKVLPSLQSDADHEGNRRDEDNNTLLHLAVSEAKFNNEADADFIVYLSKTLYSALGSCLNNYNQTALSIACENVNIRIIKALAQSGVGLCPERRGRGEVQTFVSPLHAAVRDAKAKVLGELLVGWRAEAEAILQDQKQCEDLLDNYAMLSWRLKILSNQDDQDQIDVLKRLLNFDTKNYILTRQLTLANNAINQIADPTLRASLLGMFSQVSSESELIRHHTDEGAIDQKIKILGLAHALQKVSLTYSSKRSSVSTKEEELTNFILCCRHHLLSNKLKTIFGVAVCAFLGLCVGAVVGFIVGTLLTGGGPGGLVLGPPTAQYGCVVGSIVGGFIFGLSAGTGRYVLSDLLKWQRGLWASTRAMNNNINQSKNSTAKVVQEILEDESGGENTHGRTDNSLEAGR